MPLTNDDMDIIRRASKDDESFRKVIDLVHKKTTSQAQNSDASHFENLQALYQSLVDTLPMNVYRIDANGKLTFGNKFLLENLNLSLDELIGKTAYDFYPESSAKKYRHDDANVIETGKILHVVEENVSPTTNESRFVETYKIPIYNEMGQIDGIQGIFWDITERKQVEDAIRQSENRANALLEAIPDTVIHLDSEGTFIDYLEGDVQIPITADDNPIGSTIETIFPPNISKLFMHNIRQTLKNNRISTFEYEIDSDDSDELFYEVRMVKASITQVIAIIRDVTQRNFALQRELDFKLETERGKLLRKFIQDASHEFKTPLATIVTNLYMLSRLDISPSIEKRVQRIQDQTNRLSQLVDMQLMIVRLNHTQHLNMRQTNIIDLLTTAQQMMVNNYGEYPKLKIEHPPDLCDVIVHQEYLLTALCYILDNAYHFTPKDGNILLKVSQNDRRMIIDIFDDGSGIAKESLPHIFEMFWRKDEAHSTLGFGLGLPIAKKIIDIHMGEITVDSQLEQGTHVQITLPMKVQ